MQDTLESKEVITRKEHRCFGCGRKMSKGTKLERIKTVDNGIFTITYWCDICRIYWTEHMRYDDEVFFGELRDLDPEEWERIYLKRQALKGGDK